MIAQRSFPRVKENSVLPDEMDTMDLVEDRATVQSVISHKLDEIVSEVIALADEQMSALEQKQDEVLLSSEVRMPILEFGKDADRILEDAALAFDLRIQDLHHHHLGDDMIHGMFYRLIHLYI